MDILKRSRGDPGTWAVPIELIKERLDLEGAVDRGYLLRRVREAMK